MFKSPIKLRDRAIESTGYKNHIIVCGYGPIGKKVVKKLKKRNLLYLILEHDIKLVDNAIANGENSIFLANAGQKGVLEHFAVRDSMAIIVAISNQHQIRLICENIDSFNADINTIVKVRNRSESDVLTDLNINTIINSRDMISDILVERALECKLPS